MATVSNGQLFIWMKAKKGFISKLEFDGLMVLVIGVLYFYWSHIKLFWIELRTLCLDWRAWSTASRTKMEVDYWLLQMGQFAMLNDSLCYNNTQSIIANQTIFWIFTSKTPEIHFHCSICNIYLTIKLWMIS